MDIVLLLGYLSWPLPQQKLKSWYLPLGILLATIGPIIESDLPLILRYEGLTLANTLINSWQLMPVLFIPLVVIGWQYSTREVIYFCLGTVFLDIIPSTSRFFLGRPFVFSPFPLLAVSVARVITFYFVGTMIVKLMATQRKQHKELAQANTRLSQYANTLEELTLSRERNRLARELHDVLAHTLSSVAVELEAVKALWEIDKTRAQSMLDHSLIATRDGLTETRRALQELRASPVEDMGLALAIRSLAGSFASRTGVRMILKVDEDFADYHPDVQHCFYRITQEALANIAEHASAHDVEVRLSSDGHKLQLQVCDDGRGFDPETLEGNHYGIQGMRERVEMIGGTFSLSSKLNSGTVITAIYGENV